MKTSLTFLLSVFLLLYVGTSMLNGTAIQQDGFYTKLKNAENMEINEFFADAF